MFSVYFYGFSFLLADELYLSDGKPDLIIFQKHILINFLLSG